MTANEKAVETRRKHKEARERERKEKALIQSSMINAMTDILNSDSATMKEKLEASRILIELI